MALTFHHCGGDIFFQARTVLNATDVTHLMEVYREERRAFAMAGDHEASRHATELLRQITAARFEKAQWKRAAAPFHGPGVG